MKLAGRTFERIISASLSKWKVKMLLAIAAFGIVVTVILYTQYLAGQLIEREKTTVESYTALFKFFVNAEVDNYAYEKEYGESQALSRDLEFFLDEIIPAIKFPIIQTDANGEPVPTYHEITGDTTYDEYVLNIEFPPDMPAEEQRLFLKDYIREMGEEYPPIILELESEGIVLSKFYYTNSALVDDLRFFPTIAIIIIMAFIFVGYMLFSNIRRNEESKVWVGMSKEAAHQLGTPLSSLLAWLELIKMNKEDPNYVDMTIGEMESDIDRLNKIATRFSKIGSQPEMKVKNIAVLIERVCLYFERRLPNLGRRVEIIRDMKERMLFVNINEDLMEWVFENLLKNAAEAIDHKDGLINIKISDDIRNKIVIEITDNGKGMGAKVKRQIFLPGFSTKKRGWGLGLSLTRRIIEQYHDGKIFVKESTPKKGTTFQIELPVPEIDQDQ